MADTSTTRSLPILANGMTPGAVVTSDRVKDDDDDRPLDDDPLLQNVPKVVKFEGAEHRAIGDNLKLSTGISALPLVDSKDYNLTTITAAATAGGPMQFGEVISLAGDFYTNRTPVTGLKDFIYGYAPIGGAYYPYGTIGNSDKEKQTDTAEARFMNMVEAIRTDDYKYLKTIRDALNLEKTEIDTKMTPDRGNEAKIYHEQKDMHGDVWFLLATSTAYAKIAWQNADHFGNDALAVYKLGHSLACAKAATAHAIKLPDPKAQEQARSPILDEAYFIEACALHYLTDLFSSGHMRSPRRALHYPGYASKSMATIASRAGLRPVWDDQCRIMHDDDSATGLWCTNANGDGWIAFGDKQLFMPANGPNLIRAIKTAQVSVDEVFEYFSDPDKIPPTLTTGYAALKLIPTMKVSQRNLDGWITDVPLNPSPLWIASVQNDPIPNQDFSYREQVDDHSVYKFATGSPGLFSNDPSFFEIKSKASEIVSDGDFRRSDQFPPTSSITPRYGFVQLAELVDNWGLGLTQTLYMNMWTPMNFIDTKMAATITLTTKATLDKRAVKLNNRDAPKMIHAMAFWHESKNVDDKDRTKMLLFRLDYTAENSTEYWRIIGDYIDVVDPSGRGDDTEVPWRFKDVTDNSISAAKFDPTWQDRVLFDFSGIQNLEPTELRSWVVSDIPRLHDILFSVLCTENYVYWHRIVLDTKEQDRGIMNLAENWRPDRVGAKGVTWPVQPHLKFWNGPNLDRRILFCQHSTVEQQPVDKFNSQKKPRPLIFHARIKAIAVSKDSGEDDSPTLHNVVVGQPIPCVFNDSNTGPMNIPRSSCFLVGDIFGLKGRGLDRYLGEQIACLTISPTQLQMNLYGRRATASFEEYNRHFCTADLTRLPYIDKGSSQKYQYLRDYLIALIPAQTTYPDGQSAGADLLHVSQHRGADGKYYLVFRTHVNLQALDPQTDQLIKTDDPTGKPDHFGNCESSVIADELYTKARHVSGAYQSLKWLYMPHSDGNYRHGIMEIFSWYGVLGMRYFAALWDTVNKRYYYSIRGLQPYNGQASSTIGRGCSSTWGAGFMTFGTPEDFIDVNFYNLTLGKKFVANDMEGPGWWSTKSRDPRWDKSKPAMPAIVRESDWKRGTADYITPLETK